MSDTGNARPSSVPPPTDPDGSFHQHSEEIERSRARSGSERPESGSLPPVGLRSGRSTPGYDGRPGTASRPPSSRPGSGRSVRATVSEEITPLERVKKDPLPPIGGKDEQNDETSENVDLVEVDSATIAGTMAGGSMGSRKNGRFPRVVSYRPEIDPSEYTRTPDNSGRAARSVATAEEKTITGKDGADMVVKSIDCQTEWSWLKDMEMVQRMSATPGGKFSRQSTVRAPTQTPGDVNEEEEEDADMNEDPFDLPKTGASRASERKSSRASDQSAPSRSSKSQKSKADTAPTEETPGVQPGYHDDTYGIPILELSSDSDYQRESEKKAEAEAEEKKGTPGPNETVFESPLESSKMRAFSKSFFGQCEFCGASIKPFPSMEDQKVMAPEELYCCDEYREFLGLMLSSNLPPPESKLIDITPHAPHGSKQARRAAKERAAQRKFLMRQKTIAAVVEEVRYPDHEKVSENQTLDVNVRNPAKASPVTKTANPAAATMREREIQRQQAAITGASGFGGGGGGASNFYHLAQKMKTINYQLSSQKCLEEGWTLRPPSPLLEQEPDNEVFEPQPLLPPWAEDGLKDKKERGLVQKYYPDGSPFVILFPDGTGNAFYPSGRVAISISSIEQGLFTYLAHADSNENPNVLAVFDPDGHATSYYTHGGVRVCLDPFGGMELDTRGCKKRKWTWKEQVQHVHAPPIQPITFAITPHISLRIMSQDNVSLTFTHSAKSCRFQVGARLKLVSKENVPPPELDDDMLFRDEVKNRIETLFSKVSNLLKFPKCPKLDKLPGPAHVSSREEKTQKLRQSFGRSAKSEKDKKESLPVISVN